MGCVETEFTEVGLRLEHCVPWVRLCMGDIRCVECKGIGDLALWEVSPSPRQVVRTGVPGQVAELLQARVSRRGPLHRVP